MTATEIEQPQLQTYENKPYFWTDGPWVEFIAPANGETTDGSDNPRSELREMKNNGQDLASWNGGSGTHIMEMRQAITERPHRTSDGKDPVVAGQVHNADDDVSVCRLHGADLIATRGDATSGSGTKVLIPNYVLGTWFTLKMVVNSSGITYFINGVNKGTVSWPGSKSGCYFKAGAYCQANPSNGGSGRAAVRIERGSLKVTHVY